MPDECCELSRRRILQLSAAAATAGVVLPALRPGAARADSAAAAGGSGALSVQDLELVTVTDTSFVLTWYTAASPEPAIPYQPDQEPAPVAADGLVRYGTDPARLDRVAMQRGADTPYHYVEVEGLRPGTTYYYQAWSGGAAATPRLVPQLTF